MKQALARIDSTSGRWYATSGHFLWIGDRTRQPDHAHVEFLRGVHNPIGLKCGPSLEARRADPADRCAQSEERGRAPDADRPVRRGQGDEHLPPLIRAVQAEGRTVVWSCDPMHGNTIKAVSGYKTRPFDLILQGGRQLLRRAPRRGNLSRWAACRDDGQERHRMHRRRPAHHRHRTVGPLPHPLRPAAECQPGTGIGVPGGRAAAAGPIALPVAVRTAAGGF